MLTKIIVRNFKLLDDVEIELGQRVVLIGPNNSGKTSALQALALWLVGLRAWMAERGGKALPEKRPGVTINRKDLISSPVPSADLLWFGKHLRATKNQRTQNIRIDILVEGVTDDKAWQCGFEFDYSNAESFVCRPAREIGFADNPVKDSKFTSVPSAAESVKIAFLPPMSGLAAVEPKWEPGRVDVLLGEGQTAQVLRNLCLHVANLSDTAPWLSIVKSIRQLFGVTLNPPVHIVQRGEVTMSYDDQNGVELDLSCAGRGLQQTLLLLAYMHANRGSVLLLDEPDAHLEILRQRQIYQLIGNLAEEHGSQIVAASHSEVVLSEAAQRDIVVAFVGKPHRIDDRGSQVHKALREISYDKYYQAEQRGWVLFLEGSTDLAILQAFAATLNHPAASALESPFVEFVGNNIIAARSLFQGLREAKSDLIGLAIYDSSTNNATPAPEPRELFWRKREIENYLCFEEVLMAYAVHGLPDDLIGLVEKNEQRSIMKDCILAMVEALRIQRKPSPWDPTCKVSDDFLAPLFENYYDRLGVTNIMRKTNFHVLASRVSAEKIDPEIVEKLDAIAEAALQAKNRSSYTMN